MMKYQEITKARKLLKLSESATLEEIKSNYRELLNKWHPDKCSEGSDQCIEMTKKLIEAYEIIITYCSQYIFSFAKEEVAKYLSGQDWWMKRFGDDPLWSSRKEEE